MSDDKKYTLREAQFELIRLQCSIGQHKPTTEIVTYGKGLSTWLCDCQLVTYEGRAARDSMDVE